MKWTGMSISPFHMGVPPGTLEIGSDHPRRRNNFSFEFTWREEDLSTRNILLVLNQRLGECVRPKMESQVVAKEQGCWQTMPFNMPQMER